MTGIGINAPSLTVPNQSQALVSNLIGRIHELGVEHVRVPMSWRMLDDGTDSLAFIEDEVARVAAALSKLDSSVRILAFLTTPPVSEAIRAFDDPAAFSDRFTAYVRHCLERFERVDDWEVWNEPNASDFYLSRREGDGHRPWTPAEFVREAYAPAAALIRELRPDASVCLGSVAENGLVGHTDRPPALSNLLPRGFRGFGAEGPHGHFFFIPGFAPALLESVAGLDASVAPDAVACHPYPYFGIAVGADLAGYSHGLLADFIDLAPAETPIWITEVGARSLTMPGGYRRDDDQQERFFTEFVTHLPAQAERAYWFKLIDRPRDLRLEKTFGALDLEAKPRRVFHALKRHSHRTARRHVIEPFEWSASHPAEVVDPELWEVTASGPFAFADHLADAVGPSAVVSAGRFAGDWWRMQWRGALDLAHADVVSGCMELSFEEPGRRTGITMSTPGGDVAVQLARDGSVRVAFGDQGSLDRGGGWAVLSVSYQTARDGEATITVQADRGEAISSSFRTAAWQRDGFAPTVQIDKAENGVNLVRLRRITAVASGRAGCYAKSKLGASTVAETRVARA